MKIQTPKNRGEMVLTEAGVVNGETRPGGFSGPRELKNQHTSLRLARGNDATGMSGDLRKPIQINGQTSRLAFEPAPAGISAPLDLPPRRHGRSTNRQGGMTPKYR